MAEEKCMMQDSKHPLNVGGSRLNSQNHYYHDYLCLDKILTAQQPLSATEEKPKGEHDEMLFIVIHQTFELWFKQVLHEMQDVVRMFSQDSLTEAESTRALHHLTRVCAILRLAVRQFDVLETMTPTDFMAFRDYLYPASGFQSVQFRLLENMLGVDPARRIRYQNASYHAMLSEEHQKQVQEAEEGRSLFQALERWLERTPFLKLDKWDFLDSYREAVERMYDEDAELLKQSFREEESEIYQTELTKNRDNKRDFLAMFVKERHEELRKKGLKSLSFEATQAALLISLYHDQPQLYVPHQLLERVVDIDALMSQWRYRHALIVHRMIGTKLGTGGSSGYGYLKAVIEPTRVFKDIANLSTYIIRPSSIPDLPDDVQYQLGYVYKPTPTPEKKPVEKDEEEK